MHFTQTFVSLLRSSEVSDKPNLLKVGAWFYLRIALRVCVWALFCAPMQAVG